MFERLTEAERLQWREAFLRAWAENQTVAKEVASQAKDAYEGRTLAVVFRRMAGELNDLMTYLGADTPDGRKVSEITTESKMFEYEGHHYVVSRTTTSDRSHYFHGDRPKGNYWYVIRTDLRPGLSKEMWYVIRTFDGGWVAMTSHAVKDPLVVPVGDDDVEEALKAIALLRKDV